MENEIKLFRNKSKTKKLLWTSGAVCIALFFVLLYGLGVFDGILKIKPAIFAGGACIVMLTLLINSLISLKDTSAQIVLNRHNFQGRTTPLAKAFGVGNWDDVTDIQLQKVGGDALVVVSVTNAASYRNRLSSMLWKMAFDEPSQQLHIMYSSSVVDVDATALYELFMRSWEESRKAV